MKKKNGRGTRNKDTDPNRLLAQPIPRARYIWVTNNGHAPPPAYLVSPFAPKAEAPAAGPYVSRKYSAPPTNIIKLPAPNGATAMTGDTQDTRLSAVQPNQNKTG